ncbi:MAG: leucine-rich repeat protein [Clostridia bacterium]|nr:leucine-rich repeat protein [Clostridia bacterium]
MNKIRKITAKVIALVVALSFMLSVFPTNFNLNVSEQSYAQNAVIKKTDVKVKNDVTKYFDDSVVFKLPETASTSDRISVIVDMNTETVMDAYEASGSDMLIKDFVLTDEARATASDVAVKNFSALRKLTQAGVTYALGEQYDTLIGGFEISIDPADFAKVASVLPEAELIVGETYEECATEVVTNEVDVYETGIFDSSKSQYQGDGVVVAVLDTGLDYTHTAFSVDNFTTTTEALTFDKVSAKISQTAAAGYTPGLTGEDVYLNKKIPFAYDYGDKDPDVLPISSEHGTHVAGVIAGHDDVITGVAPNAQLAIMKVFSDTATGAKTSWILAALEDCVVMGVDVINMSLGTSCGFSREVDKENVNEIYDRIGEAGISLICAASNDANATSGSEKNGANPLTKHPDSGTVGAPSTFEAALSVASVDGVKTPYLLFNNEILYFTEASSNDGKPRDFVSEVLSTVGDDVDSHEFEFVTIPGIGRSSDYPEDGDFYAGKIVLVKRGTTTFEDKIRIALKEKGAAGVIIYNNVSGTIMMAVGDNVGAACSISQDQGEMLAAAGTGKLLISKANEAGPFMSDFSSWGPTSDLRIKPEITAHGGEILSAVPGQDYDRLSGTSMAAPNQAGAAALIRQYVKYSGVFGAEADLDPIAVTDLVNQLMMSTADIVYNKNGIPYAVRKQGAGLVNIYKAQTSAAYLTTYDVDGNKMKKTKLELGDDEQRTGVYEMKFDINNISNATVSYDIASLVTTEGVSETYTSHDDTTSTMDGYLFEDAVLEVISVTGEGSKEDNVVTVDANKSATVTVKITLSEKDKKYIESSFENGMYVEGFVTLTAKEGTDVSLSVPFLSFYGNWMEAPIFDEEYYDTHKDEINEGLDVADKLMPDAYATTVIGGMYSDYIAYLGSYYFQQDPSTTKIAANKEYIAISNYEDGEQSTINSIYGIWAGLLRNVKEANIVITEDATGRVIYEQTEYNVRKSYSGGNNVYSASLDMDFYALEHNLKNNTRYTVKITTYIDYGTKEEQDKYNDRNVFEFPLYIDYEAPVVTGVEYRTEYDKSSKKTKLFADISVYDNHYAMAMQLGQILPENYEETGYYFTMNSFGRYFTPIYSSYNSTSKVIVELTDYIADIKNSVSSSFDASGNLVVVENSNTFLVTCYDYALNVAQYEISLPDEIIAMAFKEELINLSPNQTQDLSQMIEMYPSDSWMQTLTFESSDENVVTVVNQTLLAKNSGDAVITAIGYDVNGNEVRTSLNVHVYAEGEDGWKKYTVPTVNKFDVVGYETIKAFYNISTEERDIGLTGGIYDFGNSSLLEMFPSESVKIRYVLDSYFPEKGEVKFSSGNKKVVTVDEDGVITAQTKGNAVINVDFYFDGVKTNNSKRISISVKDPFTINSIYLLSYQGLGGEVIVPANRGITHIYMYAFSGYEYVDKDPAAGDIIDEEDPFLIKMSAIGEDTIKKVVIPEGVTHIDEAAFSKLTALEEVVLPSTLINIANDAFKGCTKLKKINLGNVKFINKSAFSGCVLEEVDLSSVVAIGNYAFEGCKIKSVVLPETSQSLGIGAFGYNTALKSVTFKAPKIKIGTSVFEGCSSLNSIDINAAVIADYAFQGCEALLQVRFGKDVSVIGKYAFAATNVSKFEVDSANTTFTTQENGALLYRGTELALVAPKYAGNNGAVTLPTATAIGAGAFAANTNVVSVTAPLVKKVGEYAFAECASLKTVKMDSLTEIGDYAFAVTSLLATPNLSEVKTIGAYAFAGIMDNEGYIYSNKITSVNIPAGAEVGAYAFYLNVALETVKIGANAVIGNNAFEAPMYYYDIENMMAIDPEWTLQNINTILNEMYKKYTYTAESNGQTKTYEYYSYDAAKTTIATIESVEIGDGVIVGDYAFAGNINLTTLTLGNNTQLGDYAFMNNRSLINVDFSKVKSIGAYAFGGERFNDFCLDGDTLLYAGVWEYIDGEWANVDYVYTTLAPKFEVVDLTTIEHLGEGAFYNNSAITTVIFKDESLIGDEKPELTGIADAVFAGCTSLVNVTLPSYITSVGMASFRETAIKTVDLSNVTFIDDLAYSITELETVTLREGASIPYGAFASCFNLTTVNNLDKAVFIGDSAFFMCGLTAVDLTSVKHLGSFAFEASEVTDVKFGNVLASVGQNPFADCQIGEFVVESEIVLNGAVVGIDSTSTFDISETVKVIDGVIYQITPNGAYELITYPTLKDDLNYSVVEGTTRISDKAFVNVQGLRDVTIASTVTAIGDKAFFGCDNLKTVVFRSYYAPKLEEEFDVNYNTIENYPISGDYYGYEGLGISPYFMWNIGQNNIFYGANFVDYIGRVEDKLVMVKPANGMYYDSFIYGQYFVTIVEGSNAAVQATLDVIDLIAQLPYTITLNDEEQVKAIRAAYDMLPSIDQKALVTNYGVLEKAESMIDYLHNRDDVIPPVIVDPDMPEVNANQSLPVYALVIIIVESVIILAGGAFAVYWFVIKRKK